MSDQELYRAIGRIEEGIKSLRETRDSQGENIAALTVRVSGLEQARAKAVGWIAGASAVSSGLTTVVWKVFNLWSEHGAGK